MVLIKIIKNKSGVSLIELLVAMSIFTVLMLISTQIFKMVIDGQRSSLSAQNVQENMRYAMEKMSKEIRMARVSNDMCEDMFIPSTTAANKVFNTAGGNQILYFKNQYGYCTVYYLDGGRLKIMADSASGVISGFITPAKVEATNLKFYVVDDLIGAFHSKQPYVTMVIDVKAIGQAIHEQKMKIQMTVSSRYYE